MRYVTATDGVLIAYDSWGRPDGAPLLMIQGLGTDSRGWGLQRLAFGRRYRCFALDNRGVGASTNAPHPFSLEQMALDAVSVLDAEGVDRAHVMGASMGGAIAQVLGVRHPDRVRSLVLACTACRHHEWRRELLAEWAARVRTQGMSAMSGDGMRWLVGPRFHRRFGLWINLLGRMVMQGDPEHFAAQVDAILALHDDLRFELRDVSAPTLVITGSQDMLTPFGDAEELAEMIPGSRLRELRGAAHGLMVEQPNAFNRAVLEFLGEVDAHADVGAG
ncbi:MAG: alpha/beta fold hydrolase [Actinomycetes bacterium]